MFRIYGFNSFNAVKVLLTAEELGVEYDYVHVELGKGEQKTPEHLARHPFGKIPVLEHNGNTIVESAAICRYLSRLHDNKLYSTDPLQAARIDQMVDMMVQHVGRWMAVYFWQEIICKTFFNKDPEAAAIEEAAGFLKGQLPYIDNLLADNTYLCGSDISIADTIAYAYCQLHESTSIDLSPYSKILRWYGEISERPSVSAVQLKLAG
jgi:glutathione S-transferase